MRHLTSKERNAVNQIVALAETFLRDGLVGMVMTFMNHDGVAETLFNRRATHLRPVLENEENRVYPNVPFGPDYNDPNVAL